MFSLEALQWAIYAGGMTLTLSFIALIILRRVLDARNRELEAAVARLEPVLQEWLVNNGDVDGIRRELRSMRSITAFRSVARLVTQQVTFERQQILAAALRDEPWVGAILSHAQSLLWWKRFDCARLLSVVGHEKDAALMAALIDDPSPAVRLVAMDAAARLKSRPLLTHELDTLPLRRDAVQQYQFAALARHPNLVADALVERLTPDAPLHALNAWIDAAGALAHPVALERVRELATHPEPEVRVHVARALRRHAQPETPSTLLRLLADPDWRVRAQAARALGALRCGGAITELMRAVRDLSWWVRYRSALALAQIGGPGRVALIELTRCDDKMARDMSTLVSGLSTAAVIEMSEV
ncbi:MAG TPA: HEAT repeat domain-containing protein [Gemmatimonadaceae bacterium]|nr:HEAT repeat domain-containing protein [Gemmatimonadaceae bacterium]